MKNLERLPEYTDSILHGLSADQALKNRILKKAADQPEEGNALKYHAVPVLCSLVVVLLIAVVLLNELKPVPVYEQGEMTVFAAGSNQTDSPEIKRGFEDVLNSTDSSMITRIEFNNGAVISRPGICSALCSILKSKAVVVDNQDFPESDIITITFSDSASIQLEAYPPLLTDGNKVWTCREFFDALDDAAVVD